ncbi:DMT family transporter [Pseudaestuariivita sp.]|uniref:DMT family transporter n=1 Tax=Pseudaestuariivita sp. TaxID=2211669 RepID=UPI004058B891
MTTRILLLTALAMGAFAANSIINRAALVGGGIDAVSFGVIRLWAGAVMLGALLLVQGKLSGARRHGSVAGVLSLSVYIFGFSLAYLSLDAGLGALILFGTVQVTMIAAALMARERMPASRLAGAALAVGGLVWLLWPGQRVDVSPPYAALMAAAGVGWGVYSLIGRGAVDPLAATAVNFAGASLVALLLGLGVLALGVIELSLVGALWAVLSGAITSGLGYALWYGVLPHLGAARAAIAQLSVPVIAIVFGALLLGEALTLGLILPGVLVLAGVTLGLAGARR